MMAGKISRCIHISSIGPISWEEIREKQENLECETCATRATNLWLCLVSQCNYVGCGESVKDHSLQHSEEQRHCLTINLSTLRIWCYMCECEVYPERNNPPFLIPERISMPSLSRGLPRGDDSTDSSPHRSVSAGEETDSDLDEDGNIKPRGLTGLQNLGNTCYLNSAIQALSNCPPLTRFFLDCSGFVRPEKTPMISKSYMKLVRELWHKKRPSYVVPNTIVSGIKVVHPMFRGYSQQDTQEFLRCFMDELHEELKQPILDNTKEEGGEVDLAAQDSFPIGHINTDRQLSVDTSSNSSQSDVDYETCDSAIGSDRSSAENNCSSDENSDLNEHSRLRGAAQSVSKKRLGKAVEEVGGNTSSSCVKAEKEHLNLSKNATEVSTLYSSDEALKSDGLDYADAASETEPLRAQCKSSTKKASSVEREQPPLRIKKNRTTSYSLYGKEPHRNIQHRSVISDVFDGKLLSSVQCLTCERVSTTKETFQDLSLPIPSKDHLNMLHSHQHTPVPKGGACSEVRQGWLSWMVTVMKSWVFGPIITLQDCLAAFFSADELKGDNMYSCEKCQKLRNGIKYSKVLHLPEVLCIHLKRFRHEFYSSKISSSVAFPLENLDMKPYLHKDHTSAITMYDLVAVICHHGTAGGGHYTAYCQNYLTEQWYEYDDQYVTEVDVDQVLSCEAYVLFYRKQNDHMTSVRQEAMELMESREPSLMQFFVSKQWINCFNTFAEPGPITNGDFLCKHGGVPPSKVYCIDELVQPLTQSMWEFLHERFGGGPSCNHLFPCAVCQQELESIKHRQKAEIESFIQLNEKFKEEDDPLVIYGISMSWFKEWENFVRGKTDVPPSRIDNKRISMVKNGLTVVKPNSDHGQLSGDMWHFLHEIYDGGPELVIKQVTIPTTPTHLASSNVSSSRTEKLSQETVEDKPSS